MAEPCYSKTRGGGVYAVIPGRRRKSLLGKWIFTLPDRQRVPEPEISSTGSGQSVKLERCVQNWLGLGAR